MREDRGMATGRREGLWETQTKQTGEQVFRQHNPPEWPVNPRFPQDRPADCRGTRRSVLAVPARQE